MSSGPSMRVNDQSMPRSLEVVHAYAARRGPVTLDSDQLAVLVGRSMSMLLSGASHTVSASNEGQALVAAYMAAQAGSLLRVLGVSTEDIEMLHRAVADDLRSIDPQSL